MDSSLANILIGLLIIGGSLAFGFYTKNMMISVVIIVVYLVYILLKHGYTSTKNQNNFPLPTSYYMRKVGAQCPDYWNVVGQDSKNVTCQNEFDIRVNFGESKDGKKENCQECKDRNGDKWKKECPQCRDPEFKCYTNPDNKTIKFPVIKKWPVKNNQNEKIKRCQWWANCGITKNQNASWVGLDC